MQKPILDETKLPVVMEIIDRLAVIFDEEDYEDDDVIKEEISELESKLIELTGKNIEQCQPFQNYWAYTDLETVARGILLPEPQKENLSDEQLREIFENIVHVRQGEAETDYLLKVLKIETGIEDITDYIYYPEIVGLGEDACDEEIFQKIMSEKGLRRDLLQSGGRPLDSYGKENHISVWVGKCSTMEQFNAYINQNYALADEDDVSLFQLGNDFGILSYDEDFSLVNYCEASTNKLSVLLETGAPDYVTEHFVEKYGEELDEEYNCAVMFYDMEYTGETEKVHNETYGEFVFLGSLYSDKLDMLPETVDEHFDTMTEDMETLIHKYWEEDQHDKIVEMILAVPEDERDIYMWGQLVVAYNNLGKYNDAIALSKELEEESVEEPAWYYRIGFAYVSKADYFTAAQYLEKGITLANKQGKINNAKNCLGLYEECEPYLYRAKKKPIVPPVIMNAIGLDDYKKAVFVNGMTEAELLAKIKEYEEIASGGEIKATIHLKYAPVNADWIYVDYEYAPEFEGWNFWHYQNFLLWLADGKNDSFCVAYKELHNNEDMLYSYFNRQDKSGASVVGWFKGAQYYYEVPGFYLRWLTEEGVGVLNGDNLYTRRGMDMAVLEHMEDWSWKRAKMVVSD